MLPAYSMVAFECLVPFDARDELWWARRLNGKVVFHHIASVSVVISPRQPKGPISSHGLPHHRHPGSLSFDFLVGKASRLA